MSKPIDLEAFKTDLQEKAKAAAETFVDTIFVQENIKPGKHYHDLVEIGNDAGMTGMLVTLRNAGMLKPPDAQLEEAP